MRCSNVLVWVRDIHEAVRDYTRLGFNVDYATAKEKARYAHIWFSRGPVLEFVSTPRFVRFFKGPINLMAGRGAGRRMVAWGETGEGFCDVAVVTDGPDLAPSLATLRDAGVDFGKTVDWTRVRPDGQRTRFRFAFPVNHRLPFLMTPYDPPQHPETTDHPNGATALGKVWMGARPEDVGAVRRCLGEDPVVEIQAAEATRVSAIAFTGLDDTLDPGLAHGVVVRQSSVPRGP